MSRVAKGIGGGGQVEKKQNEMRVFNVNSCGKSQLHTGQGLGGKLATLGMLLGGGIQFSHPKNGIFFPHTLEQ